MSPELADIMDSLKAAREKIDEAITILDPPEAAVPLEAQPVTYAIPGAPPQEHKVLTSKGRIFRRQIAVDITHNVPGGIWEEADPGPMWELSRSKIMNWVTLLIHEGPLTLLEPTPQEQEEARIYGPPGARWGNPNVPCPFHIHDENLDIHLWCTLGTGHIGAHHNGDLELGITSLDTALPVIASAPTRRDMENFCTCGTPARHAPNCPRYPYQNTEHHNV